MNGPLFFQRRFLPMWATLAFGAFTDNLMRQALIIGVAYGWVGGGGVGENAVPVIGSILAVAILLFSAIGGQLAEKYETARMFRRTKLLELGVVTFAALGFALDSAPILIAALFALGAQTALFSPVRVGAMPKYLQPDELVRGNGLCNAGLYVFILLGLFLGGLLVAREGGGLIVAGVMLCSSLAGLAAAFRAPEAPAGAPDLKLDYNPFTQTARMLALAFAAPGVGRPLLGAAFFYYITTLITVLTPLFAKSVLGADETVATAIMGLFAVGAGCGAIAAASLSKGKSGLGYSTLGMTLAAAASLIVFVVTGALTPAASPRSLDFLVHDPAGRLCAISFVLAAAAAGLFVVPLQAAMQRRAPVETRARIMAAGNMANAAAAMAGSLSVLAVTRLGLDARDAFLGIAGLQAVIAVYMAVRRARVPAGLHDEILGAKA
jgi:MFS family permease